jgi:hypothetical protein
MSTTMNPSGSGGGPPQATPQDMERHTALSEYRKQLLRYSKFLNIFNNSTRKRSTNTRVYHINENRGCGSKCEERTFSSQGKK